MFLELLSLFLHVTVMLCRGENAAQSSKFIRVCFEGAILFHLLKFLGECQYVYDGEDKRSKNVRKGNLAYLEHLI